jgi:hypothetical protein
MEGGHVGVKINDQVEKKIRPKKELDRVIHYHLSSLI